MNEDTQNRSNKPNNSNKNTFLKTGVIGVVAGLLGGGVAYAGLSQANSNNSNSSQTAVVQPAKTTKSSKNTSQATVAFDNVKNAVVSVENLQKKGSSNSSDVFGLFDRGNSSSSSKSSSLETYSEGSGVIYMKSDGKGYIVTNNHVVEGSDALQVILSDGKKVTAKKVGSDAATDLAVLTIDSKYVTQTAQFGSSKNLQPGEEVIAVGSPLGSEYATSVTQGIISANNRTVDMTDSDGNATSQATVIQTDAAINPGNSGGPLVNMAGQVIGINSMKLAQSTDGTAVEGMGFAIPSDEVVSIINEIVKNGKVERPTLGIKVAAVSELTDYGRRQLKLPDSIKSGIYVDSVTKNSNAARAGLKAKDIITKVDGKSVSDVAELHTILYSHKVGDTVNLEVVRNGGTKEISVKLS
ncbi:S1C family serine protease [Lactobacillus sp. PV034]|uniref:S1C family serine protease n=1 Tax=Lactobacillus sp. PV034 TaxID=2594495 RepID=UPI002240D8B6|nr:trypsin-like peptidase domain-containing protein [Lactobacillus sp. PV034]QNQ81076.1 PDZ domain-containing protein [Lactobacillus sp. PV034]